MIEMPLLLLLLLLLLSPSLSHGGGGGGKEDRNWLTVSLDPQRGSRRGPPALIRIEWCSAVSHVAPAPSVQVRSGVGYCSGRNFLHKLLYPLQNGGEGGGEKMEFDAATLTLSFDPTLIGGFDATRRSDLVITTQDTETKRYHVDSARLDHLGKADQHPSNSYYGNYPNPHLDESQLPSPSEPLPPSSTSSASPSFHWSGSKVLVLVSILSCVVLVVLVRKINNTRMGQRGLFTDQVWRWAREKVRKWRRRRWDGDEESDGSYSGMYTWTLLGRMDEEEEEEGNGVFEMRDLSSSAIEPTSLLTVGTGASPDFLAQWKRERERHEL